MALKDPKIEDWVEDLEHGLEYRRQFGVEDKWGEFEAIYYNVHKSRANDGPNVFLSTGDAMLSSITVPTPRVTLKATTQESVDTAPLLESIDNKLIRAMDTQLEADQAALHAYLFGRGFMKIGFDSEYGFDPRYDVGGALKLGFTLTQLNSKTDRRLEHDQRVSPGMPWTRCVAPHDIILPWGTKTLSNCPWIAHRFIRQIDDLKADVKYENTRNIVPTHSMQDFMDSYRAPQTKLRNSQITMNTRKAEYVELYEVHDRRTGRIYVVGPEHGKYLRNEENSLQIENRLPFASIGFTPMSRSFWTTPDVYYLYSMQNELSDLAIQRTKQRRISVLKFLYDSDAISETELEKLLSVDVGVAAKVNGGRSINDVITKLENNPNQFLVFEEEHLRANVREQVGFSRNQLGEYTGGRKTATEVMTVDRSSSLRMSRRGLQMKRFYEDIFTVLNPILFQYWTTPQYVEVLGQNKGTEWMRINGPALRGNYEYEVTFTDESEMRSRKIEALQLYGFLVQDPAVDPVALRQFLVHQFNDPEFERIFNADIRGAMQQMRGSGGNLPQEDGFQAPRMLPVPGTNGQSSGGIPDGFLAG